MPPSSKYKTLANIRSAIILDTKSTTASNIVTLVDRWVNEGYEILAQRKKRKWLDQQFVVQLNAAVEATCTVTNGSTTVTFTSGTTFPAGVELAFYTPGFEEVYNVSSATLNVVTLEKGFLGTSSTSASGVVFQKSVLIDNDVREVYQVYHQHHAQPLSNKGPQEFRRIEEMYGPQLDYASAYTIFGKSSSSLRMLLFPYPQDAYTLYIDANVIPEMLSSDTDEPLLPIQFRQLLYWYGMYKMWSYMRNDEKGAEALALFEGMSKSMDGELSPTIDYPQITPARQRRTFLKNLTSKFDPRLRDS